MKAKPVPSPRVPHVMRPSPVHIAIKNVLRRPIYTFVCYPIPGGWNYVYQQVHL